MKLAKKSAAYISTERLLVAIRDHKSIETTGLDNDAVARLINYCERKTVAAAVKEIRDLSECGLREALDLYNKYIRPMK